MGETKWALRQKRTRDVTKIHILSDIERSFRSNRFRHSTCLLAARSSRMQVFHAVKASSILNRSAMLTIWWVLSISASGSFAHREIEDKRLFIRAAIWPERLNLLGS